jgi:enoyl-CoA hydratase/carnithine racemase
MIETATRDAVTTITLNRPDKLNAFAGTMREDLLRALRTADGRVVVITGAGRAFCAGGDVENMARLVPISRGSVHVPPQSGWMPMRTNVSPSFAASDAMR